MRVAAAVAREREQRAWTLRLQGLPQVEIARQLGVTPAAVSYLLKRLCDRTTDDLSRGVSAHRTVVFARLETLYREAYEQWREGCTTGKANFKLAQTCIRALAEQSKLLGLASPVRIELQESEPEPEPVDLSALSDDEVITLRDLMRKARNEDPELLETTATNGSVPTVRSFVMSPEP